MFPIRDHNPSGRWPVVTYLLMAVNIGVFLSYYLTLDDRQLGYFFYNWGFVPGFVSQGVGLPGSVPGNGDQVARAGLGGTVASVSDTSFTVEGAEDDTITVTVTDDTKITRVDEDGQEAAIELADLKAGDNADIAMARADEAMYAQKKAGRAAE